MNITKLVTDTLDELNLPHTTHNLLTVRDLISDVASKISDGTIDAEDLIL